MPVLSWKGKDSTPHFPPISLKAWQESNSSNWLLWGDNGAILQHLSSQFTETVDLIYLDPPFCSEAKYHQKIDADGISHQRLAYNDSWDEDTYLQFIYTRLLLLKQLLSPTGSIFLHCDSHQSHHLRAMLDEVFGRKRFRNEIIWHYTGGGRAKKYFSQKHDTIFWYSRSSNWTFNIDAVRIPYSKSSGYAKTGIRSKSGKRYYPNPKGKPLDDTWSIPIVNPMASERNGYPTQKPRTLLDRIVLAASMENDLILDPFLGSGTTAESALAHHRRFIGIDSNINSIHCTTKRLLQNNLVDFAVHSTQPVPTRHISISLEQHQRNVWHLSFLNEHTRKDSTLQHVLLERNDGCITLADPKALPLEKVRRLLLIFLDGSQAQFSIPSSCAETLQLSSH